MTAHPLSPASRKLLLLLTRFPGAGSRAVGLLTWSYYTHASIGLEEDPNTFYSFVCKGFIVEKINRYLKPDRPPFPCTLYELEVSEETYQEVKRLLQHFVEQKDELHYSRLGVALSILRIPYRRKGCYFCSQFVAEVLWRSRAAQLKKSSALYLPRDLHQIHGIKIRFCGNLLHMLNQMAPVLCPT